MKRLGKRIDACEDRVLAKLKQLDLPVPKRLMHGIALPGINAGWTSTAQYQRDYRRIYGNDTRY